MKNVSTAMANHLRQPTTTLTTLWKITRMDGRIFAFTELDRDVPYQGLVYKSTGGFNKSAVKSTGTFSVDNLEVNGFLSDETIPDDELRNGAFDYAEVEIFLVNYLDTSMGDIKLRYGFFGEVRSAPSGMFLVELRGLIQLLSVRIGETYVPECEADLGDERCKTALTPPVYAQNTTYKQGDRVIVPTASPASLFTPVSLTIVNPGFETGTMTGAGGDWIGASLAGVVPGTINLDPYVPPEGGENNYYLRLSASVFRPRQEKIALEVGNATAALLDTGKLTLRFKALTAALELNSGASVQIIFTNASFSTISSYTHDFGVQRPDRVWRESSFDTTIPAGARYINILLSGYNNDPMGFMQTCWDNIRGEIHFPDPEDLTEEEFTDYRVYENVEWEASAAGMSGSLTKAAFVGQTEVVDVGMTWTKVTPKHMFVGEVTEDAAEASLIKVSGLAGKPAGWFDWGVVKFLSGDNVGRAVEVQSFNATTGEMRLVMPLPYSSKAGDKFQVHTGCDKSRETCHAKFANILNFRGKPDVPGLNQYFKVGGMT